MPCTSLRLWMWWDFTPMTKLTLRKLTLRKEDCSGGPYIVPLNLGLEIWESKIRETKRVRETRHKGFLHSWLWKWRGPYGKEYKQYLCAESGSFLKVSKEMESQFYSCKETSSTNNVSFGSGFRRVSRQELSPYDTLISALWYPEQRIQPTVSDIWHRELINGCCLKPLSLW